MGKIEIDDYGWPVLSEPVRMVDEVTLVQEAVTRLRFFYGRETKNRLYRATDATNRTGKSSTTGGKKWVK